MRGQMAVLRAEPNPESGGYPALGLCGVGVDCTGCGDGEVLANAGRF